MGSSVGRTAGAVAVTGNPSEGGFYATNEAMGLG